MTETINEATTQVRGYAVDVARMREDRARDGRTGRVIPNEASTLTLYPDVPYPYSSDTVLGVVDLGGHNSVAFPQVPEHLQNEHAGSFWWINIRDVEGYWTRDDGTPAEPEPEWVVRDLPTRLAANASLEPGDEVIVRQVDETTDGYLTQAQRVRFAVGARARFVETDPGDRFRTFRVEDPDGGVQSAWVTDVEPVTQVCDTEPEVPDSTVLADLIEQARNDPEWEQHRDTLARIEALVAQTAEIERAIAAGREEWQQRLQTIQEVASRHANGAKWCPVFDGGMEQFGLERVGPQSEEREYRWQATISVRHRFDISDEDVEQLAISTLDLPSDVEVSVPGYTHAEVDIEVNASGVYFYESVESECICDEIDSETIQDSLGQWADGLSFETERVVCSHCDDI